MKNIKEYIIESNGNVDELISYIQNVLDTNKDLDKDQLNDVMNDVRDHTKGYSNLDYRKVEQKFKISKAYPNPKTNIEQWVMSKIYKK